MSHKEKGPKLGFIDSRYLSIFPCSPL